VGTYSKVDRALTRTANPDVNYKSWSTRHIEFTSTPLHEVIRVLNKTYGSQISITGPVPDSCFVTVTFDQQSLEAVLRVLEKTLNLSYRVEGDRIEITSAGC
jgi:ferric-dicitrate binding protein FerR (iron transport regulator)